jgi:2-polyprenyl-6-methoxyphenol hydroxylase-like FAD-dependent oxidoreductase
MSKDLAWHHRGIWKMRIDSGVVIYTQTRPFLEWHIRQRVLNRANVSVITECDVESFVTDESKTRVIGVSIKRRDGNSAAEQIMGNLVVDASGRGSQTPRWLQELGYEKPQESVIKINVGYATRLYRRLPSHQKKWKALMLYPTPPQGTRMGMLFPIEGDRWIVSLIGWVGDHAPLDEQGYLEWARGL